MKRDFRFPEKTLKYGFEQYNNGWNSALKEAIDIMIRNGYTSGLGHIEKLLKVQEEKMSMRENK